MQTLVGEETEEEETDVESDGEYIYLYIFELFQFSQLTCDQGNLDTLQIAITCNKMSQFKEIIVSMK